MRVYAFDLMPWPHLEAPSYYPDANARFDPVRGQAVYAEHLDLTQKHGLTFVGDPDHVVREIRAQMRELGAGTLMGLLQFGSLPHALACRNIELFAERVLPELRRG